MPESVVTGDSPRVAVYLDFDNIVISRYDQVHGRNSFQKDKARGLDDDKLTTATVDLGAIIDFASSFGTLVLTRAYADWSAALNAKYQGQLVGRAVDLVQLFPAAAYGKNGADIRLAVDAVEDMFRLPDLTHVVIVGGDSDYIALAQRCKRLGRYVVGIGVAGAEQPVAGVGLRRVRHLRRAARHPHRRRRARACEEGDQAHQGRRSPTRSPSPRPRTPRPRRRACWNGRCASDTRRTTPTGCTTRRSRPR